MFRMMNYVCATIVLCLLSAVNSFVVQPPASFSGGFAPRATTTPATSQVCGAIEYILHLQLGPPSMLPASALSGGDCAIKRGTIRRMPSGFYRCFPFLTVCEKNMMAYVVAWYFSLTND